MVQGTTKGEIGMSKMFKTGFSTLCMALILVFSMAVSTSAAGSEFTIENGVLTKYNGSGGDVVIPDGVTSIGDSAFSECFSLTSVAIPDSVTSISNWAFHNCFGLTSVAMPNNLTAIGDYAFLYCNSLTSVTIPNSLTNIGDYAFSGCESLRSVTIPNSFTTIGAYVFYYCNLTSVSIPNSVTTIGDSAFEGCGNLMSVTIPNSVTSIGKKAFSDCGSLTAIHGVAGSYAESWSATESIPFVADQTWTPPLAAYASSQTVEVDGRAVVFQMYALRDQNNNLTNYVKARDVAQVLNGTAAQFNVTWDGAVNLVPHAAYVPDGSEMNTPYSGDRAYHEVSSQTKVNGSASNIQGFVLHDDTGGGYTYYKLRDLGEALGFDVGWSAERGVYIETDNPYYGAA